MYDDDPVAVARGNAAAGAEWIHVVDLDAARTGEFTQLDVIEAICAAVPSRVQVGGGIRSLEAAGEVLGTGAARVVVGTAAVERPELVDDLAAVHPGAVAVGLDARGREVAVRGWTEGSGADLLELAADLEGRGAAALVVTEIGRDGMLTGPDVEQLSAVLGASTVALIASGGVGSLEHLRALREVEVDGRRLHGVIVGTALYEGRFTVAEAVDALAG